MGGGGDRVEESEYQNELAKIAKSEWNRYQDVYVPLENKFMGSVKKMGSEQTYQDAAGGVNTGYQSQFGQAAQAQQKQMAAGGVDPSSGKAQSARNQLSDAQAAGASDATSRAQQSVTEAYTGGLGNIVAMGKGQQTQAINSLQDINTASQRQANQEAIRKSQEASIPAAAAGGLASAAVNNPEAFKNAYSNIKGGLADFGGSTLPASQGRTDIGYA